jgi:hypothetical protein
MSKKNKLQGFAMKSVEQIADGMAIMKLTGEEERDLLLLKIAFLLEDIRDALKKKK